MFSYHPAIILTFTCATLMRVRFVYTRDANFTMADTRIMPWPGHFNTHITSLFVVRKIKCWYSFFFVRKRGTLLDHN